MVIDLWGNVASCLLLAFVLWAVRRNLVRRRRTEVMLRDSEEQLRIVLSRIKDQAIFMISVEGRILSWNSGAEALTGRKETEAIAQPIALLFTKRDTKKGVFAHALRVAREEGEFHSIGQLARKSAPPCLADFRLTSIRDANGTLRGYSMMIKDLGPSSLAERAAA